MSLNLTNIGITKGPRIVQTTAPNGRRIKERMIEDAVYLVLKWRQLSEQTTGKKVTLKEGADIVGVAKKSLDDYLLQLRLGRKYGFDFSKYGNSKIGVLRTFNKTMKKKTKEGKFMPGRKKKEEEEDYTEMIQNIISDIQNVNAEPQAQVNDNLSTSETVINHKQENFLPKFEVVENDPTKPWIKLKQDNYSDSLHENFKLDYQIPEGLDNNFLGDGLGIGSTFDFKDDFYNFPRIGEPLQMLSFDSFS